MDELVKKAICGSESAFTKLLQLHKVQLYKMAYSYLRNENDALEAVQEVTFRAYRSIKKLENPAFFSTWLIRIMLNYCHDVQNKKKRFVELQEEGVSVDYSYLELEEAMQGLDDKLRDVLYLKYFHGYKIKEIAAVLDCPEGTVKTWLNKGLKAMRVQLAEKGDVSNA